MPVDAHPEWDFKISEPEKSIAVPEDQAQVTAPGFWKIVGAVFVGNLLFGIVGAIIYAVAHN